MLIIEATNVVVEKPENVVATISVQLIFPRARIVKFPHTTTEGNFARNDSDWSSGTGKWRAIGGKNGALNTDGD